MYKIIELQYSGMVIEDESRHRIGLFKGDDGKWKCLGCQRYRCDHAKWVTQQNPVLPVLPEMSDDEMSDLIDE